MLEDQEALYSALVARDPRFDGVFYVGVTSTGIYCRPVCTAKTPKSANCRFFSSAELAEKSNFRPCLRCRPELAPGNAPVDDAHRIGALIAQRIAEGAVDEPSGEGIESLAAQFGWSSRQIRRMLQKSLGVSPMELVLTRRLLLAKQLLTETDLTITAVAFASGFSSLRRFNDAFAVRYGMAPSRFRKAADPARETRPARNDTFSLLVSYRTPFDWVGTLAFLRTRTLAGVESVTDDSYARTVRLGLTSGWVRVTDVPARRALSVEMPHALTPVLPALLGRLRHLFDLSARPDVIESQLARDPRMRSLVARAPGLRVPGAFDGFELALRAVLGQQVTVKAATTIAGRFVAAFGEPLAPGADAPEGLALLTPDPGRVARATVEEVASLGIIRTRAASIIALAKEIASGRLRLEPGSPSATVMEQLTALPGIGAWTAHYIAMRALREPDALPKEDVALQKALGGVTARQADEMSQAWRPWRSYATLHLWRSLSHSSAVEVVTLPGDLHP